MGTVAFFPSKVVESHKNPNPPGPAQLPGLLLQIQPAAAAAPARPEAVAERVAGAMVGGRGPAPPSAPSTALPEGGGRAGRGGRGRPTGRGLPPARLADKKAPPVRRLAHGKRVRPSLCRGLVSKEPLMLHHQQKPLGIKHSHAEGLHRRRTH